MTTPPQPHGLTGVQLRVLRILSDAAPDTPLWALGVARAVGIPYGTVYHAFRTLYDLGWAVGVTQSDKTTGRPPRVLYRLTRQGRIEAAALLGTTEEGNPTP